MTICYEIGNALYLNVTNRCTNRCRFCVRDTRDGIAPGIDLWLEREPDVAEMIEDIKRFPVAQYDEIVFCGYGEPFVRFDDCRRVAQFLKETYPGCKIRVNTNGHGSRIAGRDITPEMEGLFDEVSISLNEKDASAYQTACQCVYGEEGFAIMLDFAAACKRHVGHVVLSVVDIIGPEDVAECRKIAERLGVAFRVRKMIGAVGESV